MDAFLTFVEVLVALGVVVAGVSNYLIINKLWKRKAKQDVAESISISAALLGLVTGIPFFIQFVLIDQSLAPALKQGFGLLTGFVFIGVGSGFWVKANRGAGFMRLFSRALNLERHESADLIKTFIQPKGAQQILTILERLAAIDQHMDEREIELIQEFARKWKIDASELTAGDLDEAGDLLAVRSAVLKYVDMRPPRDQAAQLMDVLQVFVKADAKVTAEEEMALEELTGILEEYVADDPTDRSIFEVLIVPQNDGQVTAIAELIPGVEMTALRGGEVFSVGRFFSASYAEVICQKYIALGLFTTTVTS